MYYKDDTHYFVMTAKKQSLLEKGVILHVSDQSVALCVCPGSFCSSLTDMKAAYSQKLSQSQLGHIGLAVSHYFLLFFYSLRFGQALV